MDKKSWKQFRKLKFTNANLSRRAKKVETATTRHAHKFIVKRLANLRDIRRYVTVWLVLVASLAGAVVLQLSWFQKSYLEQDAIAGGTYAEAVEGTVDTLNPLYAKTHAEITARKLLFSGLYKYDRTGHIVDDLASSMSVDETKKIYTVSLKDDLVWSDGVKITAQDVVFTVDLMKNPSARAVMAQSWKDVTARAIDEQTIEFTLPAPYAAFGDALTFAVVPKHILQDIEPSSLRESSFSLAPVGNGPFTYRRTQHVSKDTEVAHKIVHLAANPSYYHAPIHLERFELHAYDEPSGIMKAATSHDINAFIDTDHAIDTKHLPKDFIVEEKPVNNAVFALFNTQSPLLKDISLRQAIATGTNVEHVKSSTGHRSLSLSLPVIPSQIDEEASLSFMPSYNTQRAKDRLTKLGWKVSSDGVRQKKKDRLSLSVVANKESKHSAVLNQLKKQWNELGIEVSIMEYDQKAGGPSFAQSILRPRAYDVLVNELVIGADPDVFAYWHSSQASTNGLNFSNYKSKVADDILISARQRSESSLRNEKYKAFAKVWSNDVPAIPLYQSTIRYAYTKKTSSFDPSSILPAPVNRLTDIENWTANQGTVYKTP